MDKDRIDSHKLMYHPREIANWLDGKVIYPINLEIELTGACNHRCIFCAYDYTEHVPHRLDKSLLLSTLADIRHRGGAKSVLFAGTGEPTMHPDFCEIVNKIRSTGIKVAVSTNGALLSEKILESCMESISWIRFSVSAGSEEHYKKIHRGKDGDFKKVIDNIAIASELKKRNGWQTVLNVQIVMIPENRHEILTLANTVKNAGADRFIVKSFGTVEKTRTEMKDAITSEFYENSQDLKEGLKKLSDENFQTIFRDERIANTYKEKTYDACYAAPFYVAIGSDGSIYPCCSLMWVEEFVLGNINDDSFHSIWSGKRREDIMKKIKSCGLACCPRACKLDPMNQYLHELLHPGEHVDFI